MIPEEERKERQLSQERLEEVEKEFNEFRESIGSLVKVQCPACGKTRAMVRGKYSVRCHCKDHVIMTGDTEAKVHYNLIHNTLYTYKAYRGLDETKNYIVCSPMYTGSKEPNRLFWLIDVEYLGQFNTYYEAKRQLEKYGQGIQIEYRMQY